MAEPPDTLSPLFGRRYEIEGLLKLLSPLHVGSGESEEIEGVGGREGANAEKPGVARIVTDHEGKPYLPAATIKGMLRRIGEAFLRTEEVKDLFSVVKDSNNATGAMGALLLRGAPLKEAGSVAGYPYVEAVKEAGGTLAKGTFVAARTAIDPLSGVAGDGKLYFQEMIAAGATFKLRLTLLASEKKPKRLDHLLAILSRLCAGDGIVCGRGKADGSGALQLAEKSLKVFERNIGPNGFLGKDEIRVDLPAAETVKPWTGVFHCEGPFLSLDSSWHQGRKKKGLPEEEQQKIPQLSYQHGAGGRPLELGSQVAGVLRARARWLAGLDALKQGLDPRSIDPTAGDDEKGKTAAKERVVKTRGDVERLGLTPVERLFGVSGFAGLLRIEKMAFREGKEIDISSVKLDHFSGAPFDEALFKTRAMMGVRLELSLSLHARRDADPNSEHPPVAIPAAEDEALFNALKADLEKNGLMLGHGTNKGFGWFEYEGSGDDDGC